jgi:hypothetical protein
MKKINYDPNLSTVECQQTGVEKKWQPDKEMNQPTTTEHHHQKMVSR